MDIKLGSNETVGHGNADSGSKSSRNRLKKKARGRDKCQKN